MRLRFLPALPFRLRVCAVLVMGACCLATIAPLNPAAAAEPAARAVSGKSGTGDARPPADQGGGLNFADQSAGVPLEIYADQGLELSQDARTVIARTNAKAVRGRVTVTADILIAHYREKSAAPVPAAKVATGAPRKAASGGGSEVWRVEADGHVKIFTDTQTAYGDHADYNIDDAVVVLTGRDLKLVTATDTVTARDSLEYWEHRNQAVARGKAVAVRGEKRVQADVLVADFAKGAQNQMAIQKAHGYDHVILTTPREVVTGDRAEDNVETGIVTVTGSVKITRGENQLDGGYAVVNLNTGISRIFPTAPGGAEGRDQRVRGLFVPQKNREAPQ